MASVRLCQSQVNYLCLNFIFISFSFIVEPTCGERDRIVTTSVGDVCALCMFSACACALCIPSDLCGP